jgi:hypothetical protein
VIISKGKNVPIKLNQCREAAYERILKDVNVKSDFLKVSPSLPDSFSPLNEDMKSDKNW